MNSSSFFIIQHLKGISHFVLYYLDANTSFDLYESKAREFKDELVGLKISNDINYEITDFSTHFIDRVLGQTSTSHEGMRLGTTIEQLKDSIANPRKISEPYYVPVKKAE